MSLKIKQVEKHLISCSDKNFKQIDELCFQSKNLYNYANYLVRQEFIKNRKWIRYNQLDKIISKENRELYSTIPNNTSQQILMLLDRNWKSFFQSIKLYMKQREKFLGRPKLPKYKDKKGRNLLVFTSNQFKLKAGFIHFPKKCKLEPIKTMQEKIQQVRIIPFKGIYKIEIIYEKEVLQNEIDKTKWLSIDLGINNICSLTSNVEGLRPLLINGKHIKSINAYFNKKQAKLKSEVKLKNGKHWSKRLSRLNLKRDNKIENEFHKISKYIINYCISNKIGNIVIGKNKGWKQEVGLGKIINQSFVQIPYEKLIWQIRYKAELQSINFKTNEESYTSKCSAIDLEPIKKQEVYLGKRVKRGLFKTAKGMFVNADIQASLNILRKVIGDEFIHKLDTGLVVKPLKLYKFCENFI